MSSSQQFRIPAPVFKPVIFVPNCEAEIRSRPIRHIAAVAHRSTADQIGNHWCFYLSVNSNHYVRIDPNPSGIAGSKMPGGTKANIVVSDLSYEMTKQTQHHDILSVPPNVTVGHFLDAIMAAGKHKYEFDAKGRGCRFWNSDQTDLFLARGLLTNPAQAETAKANILAEWTRGKRTRTDIPLIMGAYYE